MRTRLAALLALASTVAAGGLLAQRPPRGPVGRPGADAQASATYDSSLYSNPAATSARFKALRWRLVGPFRGGRAVAVTGDPTRPLVFYFGAVNGGVWKTANGGQTWRNITDGKTDVSSVGSILWRRARRSAPMSAYSSPAQCFLATTESTAEWSVKWMVQSPVAEQNKPSLLKPARIVLINDEG